MANLFGFLDKMRIGNHGEAEVLEAITQLLRHPDTGDENFFITSKLKLPDLSGPTEVDVVLLHPSFGVFVIEVKNWKDFKKFDDRKSPFDQVVHNQQLMMSYLQTHMKGLPINVEGRVIFPSISRKEGEEFFEQNPSLTAYENITFFEDDITDKQAFQPFFRSHKAVVPKKRDFIKVAELLINKSRIKAAQDRILPVITKDEVVYFDYKQLSILEGYQEGFRIIRGVAGTGKTVILTHFIVNRLQQDPSEKFLVLVFNRRLQENLHQHLQAHEKSVAILTLFSLLNRIGFDYQKISPNWDKASFEEMMRLLRSTEATKEFQLKLRQRLQKKPIDYFLCDEAQDMPPNLMRVLYEEIGDVIFFIDEAQRFFSYSMQSIAEVFHHPEFDKVSMRGRVKNLKNVYRTPSNIAQAAFSLLSLDKALNDYYKRSFYLKNGFLTDIQFILQEGEIHLGQWETYSKVISKALEVPNGQTVILTPHKKSQEALASMIENKGLEKSLQAMTYQSIKGLEAENVILHNFDSFVLRVLKDEPEMLYRKVYVLMTRAVNRLYISADWEEFKAQPKLSELVQTLKNFETTQSMEKPEQQVQFHSLANLKPKFQDVKDGAEFVVAASELFGLVAGIFG